MRKLYWLPVLLILLLQTFCKGRENELSPKEYYCLGRDALLAQDVTGAINCFEKSLRSAEKAGDIYYKGYACQQLSAVWVSLNQYSMAVEYATLAADSLESCGEHVGEALSRLDMAWLYYNLGEECKTRQILENLHVSYPFMDAFVSERISSLEELVGR